MDSTPRGYRTNGHDERSHYSERGESDRRGESYTNTNNSNSPTMRAETGRYVNEYESGYDSSNRQRGRRSHSQSHEDDYSFSGGGNELKHRECRSYTSARDSYNRNYDARGPDTNIRSSQDREQSRYDDHHQRERYRYSKDNRYHGVSGCGYYDDGRDYYKRSGDNTNGEADDFGRRQSRMEEGQRKEEIGDYYPRSNRDIDKSHSNGSEKRRRRSHSHGHDLANDEYYPHSNHNHHPPPPKRKKKIWPTRFESSSASYNTTNNNKTSGNASYGFDARSGFFYEEMSDFFYDPKTKLYFGNEKKAYYKCIDLEKESGDVSVNGSASNFCGKKSQGKETSSDGWRDSKKSFNNKKRYIFQEIDQTTGSMMMGGVFGTTNRRGGAGNNNGGVGNAKHGEDGYSVTQENAEQDLVLQALQGGAMNRNRDSIGGKNKISICLKNKPMVSSQSLAVSKSTKTDSDATSSGMNPTTSQSSKAQKMHSADMEKWSNRVKEMQNVSSSTSSDSKNKNDNTIKDKEKSSSSSERKIKMTNDGKPICVLCKRKFPNLDMLKKHEKLSKLHKENLIKKMQKKKKRITSFSGEYRDRAKERRSMHGIESTSAGAIGQHLETVASIAEMGPSLTKARAVISTDTVAPIQTLNESNIGNKLLQKLGWKQGDILGRNNGTSEQNSGGNGDNVVDKLKHDWEQIESIPHNVGGKRRRTR